MPAEFVANLQRICAKASGMSLLPGDLASAAGLESAVTRHRPHLALLPDAWLSQAAPALLMRLGAANPELGVIVVGGELSSPAIAQALPLGLRGMLLPEIDAKQLAKAVRAVLAGELWFSRRKLLEVINSVAARDMALQSGTWQNLPALTERERAVLHEVLAGSPNKAIAKELEISEQTVKIHLQHIYRKLGVRRRLDLLLARK